MRIAYVHSYDGVTGPMLLGALLDIGASPANVEQGWRQLHLPAAELSCTRMPCADVMATQVTLTAAQAPAFLHQQSYPALVHLLEHSDAPTQVAQRVLHLLRRFVDAVTHVYGVSE